MDACALKDHQFDYDIVGKLDRLARAGADGVESA